MLLLGREIRALVSNNREVKFTCWSRDSNFRGYADHVGFFRYAGFQRGKKLGEAFGSANYIPIELIDLENMRETSGDRPYAELVDEKAAEMARVLVQESTGDLYQVIQYSLREIIRNSVEHGQGSSLIIFGQYWPALHKAEIVIYDNGVGIEQTLNEGGVPDAIGSTNAIIKAMEPAITGVTAAEREAQHEYYRNSGFGMYVTSRFCAERGHFRVTSGNSTVTRNIRGNTTNDWSFDSTCVQLVLDTSNMTGAADRILEIVAEGEIAAGTLVTASTGSKSLSS